MKKFSSVFSVVLILSIILGNFTLPVFAYDKGSVNLEQIRTKTLSNNNGTILNKLNSLPQNLEAKNLLLNLPTNIKEKMGLEKSQQTEVKKDYVEGEILVKYKNTKINLNTTSGRATALNFIRTKSLEKKEDLIKNNISVLKIKDAKTVEQKIAELKNDPNVEYIEPNYIYPWSSISPNDTSFSLQWALNNTITPTADMSAPEAWGIATGSKAVIVGVLDSGIAYNHPDLKNNMWDGSLGCKNENNQTISCPNHGWDFVTPDNDPNDDNNHGTHVAGIIGAEGNNSKGISGVNWNVKLMALKVGDYKGAITGDVIKAIDFAINNNVKVINASFSGGTFSTPMYDAINRFKIAGGIFVAAAGNESTNNESVHSYPSDYNLDNIISVAATNQNDALANFSNYGATSVDVGAPGVNILSTVAGTEAFSENFEGSTYNVASGGVTMDYWGVGNDGSSKVAYSDGVNYPYEPNAYTWLMSGTDLSNNNITGAALGFTIWCDTPSSATFDDYIFTKHFSNGVLSDSIKYDEDKIKIDGGSSWTDSGHLGYYKTYTEDISDHLSSDFVAGFTWITNSSIDSNWGCTIDNIKITKYFDGSNEQYEYMQGTSMATPHVAGLAALIEGYNPNLTSAQVKQIILDSGDLLSGPTGLVGKTVSGRRINAYNALLAAAPAIPTNPAIVNLGTAGNFSILSKTKITTTGATSITGDIGISPAAASILEGFSPSLNGSDTFSTSTYVTGRMYAADYAEPTPTALTAAVSAMKAAYTDASGRTQDELNRLGGTLPLGTTFTRGIYKWGTNVNITGDITLSGNATDIFIFIITGNLDISASKKVLLSGGAQAKNVFWVVAGTTTIKPGATFEGTILGGPGASTIAMQSGAILHGRALGQTDVTLIANTITAPAPSSAKAITAFTIPSQVGSTTINESAKTISLTMPYGTNVTALVPTITTTGVSISPESGIAHDFTAPIVEGCSQGALFSATTGASCTGVIYTVTASDGSTQAYTARVVIKDESKLTISKSSGSPLASTIKVSKTGNTDNILMNSFKIEATGSNITINKISLALTGTGATPAEIVHGIEIKSGTDVIASNDVSLGVNGTYEFTLDNALTIPMGATKIFSVYANIHSINTLNSNFTQGDSLKVDYSSVVAEEGVNSNDVTNIIGSANGNIQTFYSEGIFVNLVSATTVKTVGESEISDSGTFTINFDVTAFGGDMWIDKTPPTATGGTTESDLDITGGGTIQAIITTSGATSGVNGFLIPEGDTKRFTITTVISPTTSGFFKVKLADILYALSDVNGNLHYTNLDSFETPSIYLNAVPTTSTISGTIKYYDEIKVIPNTTVVLENGVGTQIGTTTTDANGVYQFTGVTNGGNYVVRVSKSDNVASNGMNIFDLIATRRQIAEIEIFDQIFKKIAADVNNDLSINIFDLIQIRRYVAEIDSLPSHAWKFYSSNATLTTSNYLTEGLTRTYNNLTVNSPNQDFVGVKMGDVNNSWVSN